MTARQVASIAVILALGASPSPDPPAPTTAAPSYTIQAIRYGTIRDFPVSALVMGAPKEEKTDIAMVVWLIRGGTWLGTVGDMLTGLLDALSNPLIERVIRGRDPFHGTPDVVGFHDHDGHRAVRGPLMPDSVTGHSELFPRGLGLLGGLQREPNRCAVTGSLDCAA